MTSTLSHQRSHSCANCAVAQLCLPSGLNEAELSVLENIVHRKHSISGGADLFQQGDKFNSFFAIRSGSFKSYSLTEDGRERIHGFYLSGELIGLDAVDTGDYACTMQALEASSICEIPFDTLLTVASEIPRLQRQIVSLMSQRLKIDVSIPINSTAAERLASFLLNFTARLTRYQPSLKEYHLPMSRQEIGSHLGLAVETVSRLFTQLQKENILTVLGKNFQVNDFRKLQIHACN